MKLPRPYEIVAPLAIYDALKSMRRRDRRPIEDFLYRLTRQPGTPRDFETPADAGRIHQVKIISGWLLSYRPDHAAREIRLTGVELIE